MKTQYWQYKNTSIIVLSLNKKTQAYLTKVKCGQCYNIQHSKALSYIIPVVNSVVASLVGSVVTSTINILINKSVWKNKDKG